MSDDYDRTESSLHTDDIDTRIHDQPVRTLETSNRNTIEITNTRGHHMADASFGFSFEHNSTVIMVQAVADGLNDPVAAEHALDIVRLFFSNSSDPLDFQALSELISKSPTPNTYPSGIKNRGTTLNVAAVIPTSAGTKVKQLNIGDSETYLITEEGLEVLTPIHSSYFHNKVLEALVSLGVEDGQATVAQILRDKQVEREYLGFLKKARSVEGDRVTVTIKTHFMGGIPIEIILDANEFHAQKNSISEALFSPKSGRVFPHVSEVFIPNSTRFILLTSTDGLIGTLSHIDLILHFAKQSGMGINKFIKELGDFVKLKRESFPNRNRDDITVRAIMYE